MEAPLVSLNFDNHDQISIEAAHSEKADHDNDWEDLDENSKPMSTKPTYQIKV